jgi:hypothetical protein
MMKGKEDNQTTKISGKPVRDFLSHYKKQPRHREGSWEGEEKKNRENFDWWEYVVAE